MSTYTLDNIKLFKSTECTGCPCLQENTEWRADFTCKMLDKDIEESIQRVASIGWVWYYAKRPKWCPLKEKEDKWKV